jgi:DNA-binding NtrC family response regulator
MNGQLDEFGDQATRQGLILADNICIGYQMAALLDANHWQTQVVHLENDAYKGIRGGKLNVLIADIEAAGLGGLAALIYCHHRYPQVAIYAILQSDDSHLKMLARDLAGCRGFFYLKNKGLKIDTDRGVAAWLSAQSEDVPQKEQKLAASLWGDAVFSHHAYKGERKWD